MGSKRSTQPADSKVSFDISHAPLGQRAASALVAELAKLDDTVERHYLEMKSTLDPSKNEFAKIAKYILGSANRMPELAAKAFGGYGVMVIGVVPGEVRGIPPVEMMEIDKIVKPYIGEDGPKWDLIYVPVEGSTNSVLVILVDPPQDGQDPFMCCREGDNLFNGRIYVRVEGETREARADELKKLLERGKRSGGIEAAFDVSIVGAAHPVEVNTERTIEAYLSKKRQDLLGALPQEESGDDQDFDQLDEVKVSGVSALVASQLDGIASLAEQLQKSQARAIAAASALSMTDPGKRTEDEYRAQIDNWDNRFRLAWPAALDALAGYLLDAVVIRVANLTKTFFHDVELKVHLKGEVRGVDFQDADDGVRRRDLDLPLAPRAWGPTARTIGNPAEWMSTKNLIPQIPSMYRSPLDWNNGGSVDLTLDIGELRPRGEEVFDDDELVLVLPQTRPTYVKGTWQITASGHDDIFEGELEVEIGRPLDLTDPMRQLLGMKELE